MAALFIENCLLVVNNWISYYLSSFLYELLTCLQEVLLLLPIFQNEKVAIYLLDSFKFGILEYQIVIILSFINLAKKKNRIIQKYVFSIICSEVH